MPIEKIGKESLLFRTILSSPWSSPRPCASLAPLELRPSRRDALFSGAMFAERRAFFFPL